MKGKTFLVGLLLENRPCLVVGGNEEALERAERLTEAGARVSVCAPAPTEEVIDGCRRLGATLLERAFRETDLDSVWLCVLTEQDDSLADRIGRAAQSRRLFFCAVDQPTHNSFSHVAVVRSGSVSIGVSTDGEAPGLAARLKKELERLALEAGLGAFAKRLAAMRRSALPHERRALLERAVAGVRFTGALLLSTEDSGDHSNFGSDSSGSETG